MMRAIVVFVFVGLFAGVPALAQETVFEANVRNEREHLAESCGRFTPKAVGGCAYALATESPFHVALGNLAPQNGFAVGVAVDQHYTPNESWRLSWNADAVAAPSRSWRGGLYLKLVHTPATPGVVVRHADSTAPFASMAPRELAVINTFVQTISLKTLNYFGSGQQTLEAGRSVYGERETLVGASVTYPLNLPAIKGLHPAVIGAATGRFIDIRAGRSNDAPSIARLYDDSTAPGLGQQRPFIEFREGIRVKPSIANGSFRLNYLLSAQQFRTSRETQSSFNRWTIDLQHEIPLYHTVSSTGPRELNGPDSCALAVSNSACPTVQWSHNREGALRFRLLVSASTTSDGSRVPFYFQPTLGGSDINGERLLTSYQDYRFRGPNLLALQEGFEHAIWGPFGVFVLAEQGKVGRNRGDIDVRDLATSSTVGVTVRAGGLPMIQLSWSWCREGHHIIGAMDSSLLGGSSRPPLD